MIKWKPAYSVNIAEIDKQHQKLLSLLSDMVDINNRADDDDHYDEIIAIFDELSDYTVKHFAFEEELMALHNYNEAEMKLHELEHNGFIKKVMQIRQQDLEQNKQAVLSDTMKFLVDWIAQHILDTDQQYAAFLIARGVS